jgi:hypothetical protein
VGDLLRVADRRGLRRYTAAGGRSPRTRAAGHRIAAEHVVLADECIDECREIPNIAARLVNAPIWAFWWD